MIIKKIERLIFGMDTLEEKLFWSVLFFAGLGAFLSAVLSLLENLPPRAMILSFASTLFFVVIGFAAKTTKRLFTCYFIMSVVVNTLMLPALFFASGGFSCGMVLYCLMGIFLAALYPRKNGRMFLFVSAIASYEISFIVASDHPEYVVAMSPLAHEVDVAVSFFLMACVLYVVVSFLLGVYTRERRQKDALIKQLDYFSKRDPLTGLFNRRYFIKYLEQMIWPVRKGFYVFMFDIDNFKRVNDTYGHPFGDQVLCSVAGVMRATRRAATGECAVRYGGEEFIQLFFAKNYDEALARANQLRKDIATVNFEKFPEVRVTISGGFVDCESARFDHQNKMLSVVDGLLYLAKERGKNQVCDHE